MSLTTRLERIVLDLDELIEDAHNTEQIDQLENIKKQLQGIYLTEIN